MLAADPMPFPNMKIQACVLNAMPMAPRLTSGSGNKPAHRVISLSERAFLAVQTICFTNSVASYDPHSSKLTLNAMMQQQKIVNLACGGTQERCNASSPAAERASCLGDIPASRMTASYDHQSRHSMAVAGTATRK